MSTCISPFYITCKFSKTKTPVPCGKCPKCYQRSVNSWAFRLSVEQRSAKTSLFVTLTYNTEHLPFNGWKPTLRKTDFQKFMKRLRKLNEQKEIKYFAVGEYGTKNERPHYHAIIFNADIMTLERAWALDNKKIGDIHVGSVTEASIVYTLKYMCKHDKINKDDIYGREREFRLMSKGMGEKYLTPQMKRWHMNHVENGMCIPLPDGKKIAMPRYYQDKIYNKEQKQIINKSFRIKAENQERKQREEIKDYELYIANQKEAIINKFNYKSKTRQKI